MKANCGTKSGYAPGRACSHAKHLVLFDSLRTLQVLYSQLALCLATMLLNADSRRTGATGLAAGTAFAPGLGVSHETFDLIVVVTDEALTVGSQSLLLWWALLLLLATVACYCAEL